MPGITEIPARKRFQEFWDDWYCRKLKGPDLSCFSGSVWERSLRDFSQVHPGERCLLGRFNYQTPFKRSLTVKAEEK